MSGVRRNADSLSGPRTSGPSRLNPNNWLGVGRRPATEPLVTLPRPVYPRSTYLLTRRCTQRQFLLRPDPETVNAFVYCLAVSAQRHDITVIDFIQMSNHLHDAIYDPRGCAPAFYRDFHGLLAKCVNALRGRWENFFASTQTSAVRLSTTEDLISRLVYIATNPVKAGLVERVDDWPGARGYRALLNNEPLRATRPKHFFSDEGVMPSEVTLQVAIPPELGDREEILAEVERRVADFERAAAIERKRTGRRVLGRQAVVRQRWDASPTTVERRRQPSRRIGTRCRSILFEELERQRDFSVAYAKSRAAMLSGTPIPFPDGTYWLRIFANVEVEPPQFSR